MTKNNSRVKLVLGVETSCDETACAVVDGDRRVLSSVVASQDELHAEYRGVVPEIASRAHAERICAITRRAVEQAGVGLTEIDAVAVGHRPGLIGSLLVGVASAKALAWSLGVPLVGIDHVHAHLFAGSLDRDACAYPAIGLVVSGGHTSLYRMTSPVDLQRIGATIDDAVGEAFDKAATVLGLPFPGGANLDKLARDGDPRAVDFPITRLDPQSLDFSFSGLKTAVLYEVRGVPGKQPPPEPSGSRRADIAASFQRAVVRTLLLKIERALEQHPETRTLVVGGGVSANSELRSRVVGLAESLGVELRVPEIPYCVDNAAMIAGLAHQVLGARAWTSDPLSLPASPVSGV